MMTILNMAAGLALMASGYMLAAAAHLLAGDLSGGLEVVR